MNSVRIALAAAITLTLTGAVAGSAEAGNPGPKEPAVWTVMTPATAVAARTDRRPVAGAVFDEAASTTFITWAGKFEDNYVQAYDHSTGAWSAPVKVGDGDNDSHNYPTIVQAHDGHLLVFRGLHNRELLVARSARPHSIDGVWTTQVIAAGDGATYPMPFVTSNGTIFVFVRETTRDLDHVTPTDTRPMKYVRSTDNGLTWQNTFDLTGGKYAIAPTGRADNMNEIYIGQLRLEPATANRPERVHIVYTLAGGGPEGHLHDRYHRNIYYTSFTPGDLHFHSAAGDDLGTSIDDPDQEGLLKVAQTELQQTNPRTPDYISLVGHSRNGRPFVVWMEIDTAGVLHDHTATWTDEGWAAQEFDTNVRVREMEEVAPQTWRVYATPDIGIDTYLLRGGTPHADGLWRHESTIDIPRPVQRIELIGGHRDPARILATGSASGRDVDTYFDGDIYVAGAPAASAGTVLVDTAHASGQLPGDFVGLSFEMRELGIGNLDPHKGNLTSLLRTLGSSNLRIGGNTLDRDTLWVPAGQQPPAPLPDWVKDVVRPTDIQRLRDFLNATGWKTEVGINVGRWDPAAAADQARVLTEVLGDRLVATACGNEPDQWVGKGFRPAGFAYADYKKDWEACAAVIGSHRISGPDTASPTSSWAANLAVDGPGQGLTMLAVHQYSMDPTGTAARLLSPATNAAQHNAAAPNLAVAQAQHLPMRIDETNSAYGGGINGVSNKHASALWALDYSLQMAQLGVSGINFHGGLGVCNQPIWNGKFQIYTPVCATDTANEAAQVYHAMPIYYGIWMARQMGPGTFLPLTLSTDRNVNGYAVCGEDGRVRIALIEKDDVSTPPVHLDINLATGGRSGTAQVLHLTGSALSADDTAVQGATVDADGRLLPGRADLVRVRNGALGIDLAGGSAVLITLDAQCSDPRPQ